MSMNLCVCCEKPVRLCRCKSFPGGGPTSFAVDEEAVTITHRRFGSATFPSVSLGGCRPVGLVGGKYLHVGRVTTCDGTVWEAVLNLVGFRLVV